MSGEQRLRLVCSFAVITQVQQTLRTVEISRLNALTTHTRLAPVSRFRHRLRHLAHAHRVAAAATSVSGGRRRQRGDGRALEGQPGHVTTGGAGDQAARPTRDSVVGGRDAIQPAVVGQTSLAERVTTVEVPRRRGKRRLEAQ